MVSSSTVTSFFPPPPDHISSVPLGHPAKAFDWSQARDLTKDLLDNHEAGLELTHSQDRTPPKESTFSPVRRPGSGMKKVFSPSPLTLGHSTTPDSMKANPKSAAPIEPFVNDGLSDEGISNSFRRTSNRWSYNGAEKLVTSGVPNWDLVDGLEKLKLGNASDDGSMTPPKTIVTDVLQIQEASPLDTSSSDTSLDSLSPQNAESLNLVSHTRGASTDTLSSESSSRSQVLLNSFKNPAFATDLTKDRPRSFSGAINEAELRRLQNIPTPTQLPESFQDRGASPLMRDVSGESVDGMGGSQPHFPSLAAYPTLQQPYGMPGSHGINQLPLSRQDDLQFDGSIQARQHLPNQGRTHGASFSQMGGTGGTLRNVQFDDSPYRQQMNNANAFQQVLQMPTQGPQGLMHSPTNFAYQAVPTVHAHHNTLSLGNQQQLYDMIVPPLNPAVNRTQQSFRGGHQHSASDPASLREAAALLINGGMHNVQGFPGSPAMYPGMAVANGPVYSNQFFPGPTQSQYTQDMINALNARGALQQQYTGNSTATATGPSYATSTGTSSPPGGPGSVNGAGPSANNRKLSLYKTELCRSWEEKNTCRYGPKCQFAHGEDEVRKVQRHPKYKTEICRTFWVSGSCPYGKRCCFIHTELPTNGAPGAQPGAEVMNPPPPPDGRPRSMSTTSDPNDVPISMLQRINAGRNQQGASNATTPIAMSAVDGQNYQFQKPANGQLRVDTNVLDSVAAKPTKSAYPTFGNNQLQALSPGPVTAGPEFGRQNVGIIDMPMNERMKSAQSTNPRHSFNGSEVGVNFNQQPRNVSGGSSSPFGILGEAASGTPGGGHGHGHSRSGSAGNWGSFSQKPHFAAASPYAHTPSPGNDLGVAGTGGSPWGSQDFSAGVSRLGERTWAT